MPRLVADAIKRRNYHSLSSEIFFNSKFNGKVFPKALKAISLLGADVPEVTTISEIAALYDGEDREYKIISFDKDFQEDEIGVILFQDLSDKSNIRGDRDMLKENIIDKDKDKVIMDKVDNQDALKEKVAELSKSLEDKDKEILSLKENSKLVSEKEELEVKIANFEKQDKENKEKISSLVAESRKKENESWIEKFSGKENLRILPKEKDEVFTLLSKISNIPEAREVKFSHDSKDIN